MILLLATTVYRILQWYKCPAPANCLNLDYMTMGMLQEAYVIVETSLKVTFSALT